MHSEFTFFKAGQGAFYGGYIFDPDNRKYWSIVYDCGTSPFISGNSKSLNNEIDHFKQKNTNKISNNNIDILFISHLDYDHVSGINRLLTEFNVKRIVIPYFPEEIRNFSLLSTPAINDINEDDLSIDDFNSFISNPYSYLRESSKNKPEIFIVKSEKGSIRENNVEVQDDISFSGEITLSANMPEINGTEIVVKNNFELYLQNKWVFSTYYKSITKRTISQLKASLNKLLKKNSKDDITFFEIKNLILNYRKDARIFYKTHLTDINAHGLILKHGPINFEEIQFELIIENDLRCFQYPYYKSYNEIIFKETRSTPFLGTLLMGDTSLNDIKFPSLFSKNLSKVHVFQVPHHGSEKNWNYPNFLNLNLAHNPRLKLFNIVNFGFGNRYGHPSNQVLDELKNSIVLNSQFQRITNYYLIEY